MAATYMKERNCEHYWQMVRSYTDEAADME
jgi:hypothetical protein